MRLKYALRGNNYMNEKILGHIAVKAGFICNLKCKYCCEFLPYFTEAQKHNFDANAVISDVTKLAAAVKEIKILSYSGGDVMLNRELGCVINETAKIKNIQDIYMLTNGTYIPHKDILDAIEQNRGKCRIVINNYQINGCAKNLTDELSRRNIRHLLRDNAGWYDFSDRSYRNRSVDELKQIYQTCEFDNSGEHYYIIYEGKLNMRCGVANSLLYLHNAYDRFPNDFIDLRKMKTSEILPALDILEKRGYLEACNFCGTCTSQNRNVVPADEQCDGVISLEK